MDKRLEGNGYRQCMMVNKTPPLPLGKERCEQLYQDNPSYNRKSRAELFKVSI